MIDFAFKTIGVTGWKRDAAVRTGRGNGAAAEVGAVQECILRKSFLCNGQYLDQVLYSISKATGASRARR